MRLNVNALCFVLVGLVVAFTILEKALFVSRFGHPSGDDIQIYLKIAQGFRDFENPLFNEKYFFAGYPRPPAMPVTIAILSFVPFVSMLAVANFLEIFLFPSILIATFYLVHKQTDVFTASLSTLILATSPAFWDRGAQVIPQAFDVMLFPVAVYFFLAGRRLYIPICVYLIYNHWGYALLPVGALFVFSLKYRKKELKNFGIIGAASIPLAIVMAVNSGAMLAESSGMNESQEMAVLAEPLFAVKYLGYPLFFLIFVSAARLKYTQLQDFEKLVMFWILCLVPMFVLFPDRFIGYVAQPIAIIGGIILVDILKNEKLRIGLLLAVFIFALLSQYYLYGALFSQQGVWMPLDTLWPFVRPAPLTQE